MQVLEETALLGFHGGGWAEVLPRTPSSCSGWSAAVGGGGAREASHQDAFRDPHLLSVHDAGEN